jgi:ABC-2 type transport system ATP-binding protein
MTLSIAVRDLRLCYGDVTALDGLSFALDGGKIYGLLGRNRSGKSSLLSLLAAFRRPSAGEVRIDGQAVFENGSLTRQICLIRETGDTIDDDEPVKNALSFAQEMRPNWDAAYAAALVDRFQIPLGQHVGKLSRGKRAALGIVLGLAARAPLTMFDESYIGMDAPSRYTFYDELLADFMAHPRTIILSTHLIEEVSSLFEEVVIIDEGRLVLHENAETLRSRGAAVTGPAEVVDQFVQGLRVLSERQLGRTKSAMVYGGVNQMRRRQAHAAGLDLEPIPLQDLFVHLTQPGGNSQ